jgi:16S rRNA (guanine527-N7)-methyltransferase
MTQPLAPDLQGQIERYLEEIGKWGARTNLVGSTDDDALRLHAEESLAAMRHLPPDSRVVDLGSGAGFPGLPLLIARPDLRMTLVVDLGSGAGFPGLPLLIARPDLRMTLVEARERRLHFLRHAVRTLGLECAVIRCRIEDPPVGAFDYALLRAVAPVRKALSLAAPWLGSRGEIWIWTREAAAAAGTAYLGEISLGERGRILRARAAVVSRGTL